jgi:general secretion pathway protein A
LLEQLPEEIEVAIIFNPKLTVEELLETICDEFGIRYPEGNQSNKIFIDRINEYLLDLRAKGRQAVLILEEAQNLKPEVLEQIRLLTNLETNEHKLLQMIMIGQPELIDLLSQPQLRQLSQRITARYHLGPLFPIEVPLYVDHRLAEAGVARGHLFSPAALKKLFRLSGGLPRLINVICDRALLGAYVQGKTQVDRKTLITAAREVSGEESLPGRYGLVLRKSLGILALCLIISGSVYSLYQLWPWPKNPSRPAPPRPPMKQETKMLEKNIVERPNVLSGEATMKRAYDALFKTWRITFDPKNIENVCEQAQRQKLRCLRGKATLNHLRQMNKPAVLTLNNESGEEYYGLLTSLQGEKGLFTQGEDSRTMDLKELVKSWSGKYLILWRVPPEYEKDLNLGGRGPMVAWVENQLARTEGQAVPTQSAEVYNEDLMNRIKKFQLSKGIIPDGIVGPRTIIVLSAQDGNADPVLFNQKGSH